MILTSDLQSALAANNLPLALLYYRASPVSWQHTDEGTSLFKKICEGYGIPYDFSLTGTKTSANRFHLIPAWGYGFWSDMHHVVIQALLAELLGRHPIVYWGDNSLYKSSEARLNYFEQFFEPIGAECLPSLSVARGYYPPVWDHQSHLRGVVSKWSGDYGRLASPSFFARSEEVTVAEFYTPLSDIIPWIDPNHPYRAMDEESLYRLAFSRFARPLKRYINATDAFEKQHMQGARWVAIHMRGTDKILETPNLAPMLQLTHSKLSQLLAKEADLRFFMLTDSVPLLAHFNERYPGRLLVTNSTRRDDTRGVHTVGDDGFKLGFEILLESLIALRCDYFVGSVETNVALAISSLKEWPKDRLHLLGAQPVRGSNPFLYKSH